MLGAILDDVIDKAIDEVELLTVFCLGIVVGIVLAGVFPVLFPKIPVVMRSFF